jgi:asparagine synthetase B (glutamine-hydrolysing)
MIQYLALVCTRDEQVLQQCEAVRGNSAHCTNYVTNPFQTYIFSDKPIGERLILSAINDLGDYNLKGSEAEFLSSTHDSILVKAVLSENRAVFKADHLGLMPLYYYHDAHTTIVSNNVFLVNLFLSKTFSADSLYDALLYKKPRFERTWFADIYRLKPDETLALNLPTNTVVKSGGGYAFDLLEKESKLNLVEEYKSFFARSLRGVSVDTPEAELSLSSGSDSRTVLSGLLYSGVKFKSKSWGEPYYRETKLIREFAQKFGLDWQLIGFDDFAANLERYDREAFLYSSGDAPSSHIYYFNSHHTQGAKVFQGYGGSELFKGELSDGMLNDIYSDIIINNLSLEASVEKHFAGLESVVRNGLTAYYQREFGSCFIDVNTDKGKRKMQEFLLEFIPGRIFSGAFATGLACKLDLYEPFFSRKVLKALYSEGGGIVSRISVRKDFPGSVQSISYQAKLVKALAPQLYKSKLDRGSSFSSTERSPIAGKLEKKLSSLNHHLLARKGFFSGQVDYKKINQLRKAEMLNPFIAETLKVSSLQNPFIEYLNYYYDTIGTTNREAVLSLLRHSD